MIDVVMNMRTYYIFKITPEFKTLTRNQPYNLYLALDNIHTMDKKDISLAAKLFEEVCTEVDVRSLNLSIFNILQDNDSYTKFNNHHIINNYFTDESSKLTVSKTYLKLKSTINNPTFFSTLKVFSDLFVVDFAMRDYFWLS